MAKNKQRTNIESSGEEHESQQQKGSKVLHDDAKKQTGMGMIFAS